VLAWLVGIWEVVGGVLIFVGFFTRIATSVLMVIFVAGLWLTVTSNGIYFANHGWNTR